MRRFWILGLAILAMSAVAVTGCGEDEEENANGGAGGTGGDGGTGGMGGTGGGTGECTDLTNLAPQITEMDVAQDPPAPVGLVGITELADGIYFFTADTVYTGVGGSTGPTDVTHKDTWRITGDQIEVVHQNEDGSTIKGKGTYSISGTTMSVTLSCPAGMENAVQPFQFTATASEIHQFDDDLNNVNTYTLQP